MEDVCKGCDVNMFKLFAIFEDHEKKIDFLCSHRLILRSVKCPNCSRDVYLNDKLTFRCERIVRFRSKKKIIMKPCRFSRSAKTNTWFYQSKLGIMQIMTVTYLWNQTHKSVVQTAREAKCTEKTVIDWFSFCQEVVLDFCFTNSDELGGVDTVVEIDAVKLNKQKYEGDHVVEDTWVVGGVQRNSKKIFMVTVDSKEEEVLLDVIQEHVLPGTHIVTNSWREYHSLGCLGYTHTIVSNKKFVEPDTDCDPDTQNMKRKAESCTPKYGRRKPHLAGYLAESMFKRIFPTFEDRFHNFLLHAAKLNCPAVKPEED